MLLVSECIARSALVREESRGGHTREDFPKMDSKWRQVNNVSAIDGEGVKCVQEKAKMLTDELANLFDMSELAKYFTEEELAGVKGGSH
jgi:succinate dehydrogenase / fumarate reductase flavoprotein subunit